MNRILNEISIVKDYEYKKPEIDAGDYKLDDAIKHCKIQFFHTFEFSCV